MSVQRRDSAGWAVHPGEILREEFMKPREMSSYHLAKKLHVSTPTVNDIVLERRAVTAETAVLLARYFGTTEQFWLNLQSAYDVYRTKQKLSRRLKLIKPLVAV